VRGPVPPKARALRGFHKDLGGETVAGIPRPEIRRPATAQPDSVTDQAPQGGSVASDIKATADLAGAFPYAVNGPAAGTVWPSGTAFRPCSTLVFPVMGRLGAGSPIRERDLAVQDLRHTRLGPGIRESPKS
jgi:hypothetical protein